MNWRTGPRVTCVCHLLHEEQRKSNVYDTRPYPQHHEIGPAWLSDPDRPAVVCAHPTFAGRMGGPDLTFTAPFPSTSCGAGILTEPTAPHSGTSTSGPPIIDRWPVLCSVHVTSISGFALDRLTTDIFPVRELARFDRAIDLVVGETVLALVLPGIGNGPFHAVVPQLPSHERGMWECAPGGLRYGPWRFAVTPETAIWDPRPRWEALTVTGAGFGHLRHTVSGAIARQRVAHLETHFAEAIDRGVARLLQALACGRPEPIEAAARNLAGLGSGLTPYGDDVLAGVVLALWAAHHPRCCDFGRHIALAAAPQTNRLSRAFLDAAGQGLANADWHDLLAALGHADLPVIESAAQRILAVGATSGVAMLHGFVRGFEAVRR